MSQSLANEIKSLIDRNLNEILSLRSDFISKEDGSYVSKGDLLISDLLKSFFSANYYEYIYISEENIPSYSHWNVSESYIFVDPIDGTENFVSGLKEWGVGISIYNKGQHDFSLIYLPELYDFQYSGSPFKKYESRIVGISSSLYFNDLQSLAVKSSELRITGCSMYNLLSAARGSFRVFENAKGVNCWDILPGINLAMEMGCQVLVDGEIYSGEPLFPTKKYKVLVTNE